MLCHNSILECSLKFIFFQNKIKNKIKASSVEKQVGEHICNFKGSSRSNCTPLCPNIKKKYKFNVILIDYYALKLNLKT